MTTDLNKSLYVCEVCKVFCSSALHLSDHIGGAKHMAAMRDESPEILANLQRLQYFVDTFLKDEPMLGLEYIVEYEKNGIYTYKCLLCDTQTPRGTTILHLCGAKHRRIYLEKHYPEIIGKHRNFRKRTEYIQAMKAIALQVERAYGRKHVLEAAGGLNRKKAGPKPAEVPKMPSMVIPEAVPSLKGASRQIPSEHKRDAKFTYDSFGISGRENRSQKTEKLIQREDFTTNDEFLDYLRSFEIKTQGDASFIQQITENCTKALMKFREDEMKTQISSTTASNRDPKFNKSLSDKASISSTNSHKECSASTQVPPNFPDNETTRTFFNSIKNMNTSEVIDVLQKIAFANPAFRGINIPSLIKYLQETGRLKNS